MSIIKAPGASAKTNPSGEHDVLYLVCQSLREGGNIALHPLHGLVVERFWVASAQRLQAKGTPLE
jgi:hypothetical protein